MTIDFYDHISPFRVARGQHPESGSGPGHPDVLTVETGDFWKVASMSPGDQDYHNNQSAKRYRMVGDAQGHAMVHTPWSSCSPVTSTEAPEESHGRPLVDLMDVTDRTLC